MFQTRPNPTLEDIKSYNVGIAIEELKANVIPSALPAGGELYPPDL